MVCPWLKGGAWYCNDPEGGEGTGRIARELLLIQQLHDHLVKHVWKVAIPSVGNISAMPEQTCQVNREAAVRPLLRRRPLDKHAVHAPSYREGNRSGDPFARSASSVRPASAGCRANPLGRRTLMTERQERFSVEEVLFSWQKGPFPCDAGRTGQVLLHDPGLSHGRRRKVWAVNGQAPVLFKEF